MPKRAGTTPRYMKVRRAVLGDQRKYLCRFVVMAVYEGGMRSAHFRADFLSQWNLEVIIIFALFNGRLFNGRRAERGERGGGLSRTPQLLNGRVRGHACEDEVSRE